MNVDNARNIIADVLRQMDNWQGGYIDSWRGKLRKAMSELSENKGLSNNTNW